MADLENEVNSAGEIGLGVTEAESLTLAGDYAVESSANPAISGGAMIKSTGTGTAAGTFTGPAGTYWLDVSWINENDGVAQFAALVNGVEVGAWSGAGGDTSGEVEVERIAVTLETGDTITLRGIKNLGEPARIDFITVSDQSGNTDPSADDDEFATDMGTPLTVAAPGILDNDSDLDGDTLNVSQIVTDVSNGTLAWNADGSFTYTPNGGFSGEDSFTYEVSDGNGGTAEATVTITVEDPNAIEGALIDVGVTEAESLDLGGAYAVETSTKPEISGGAMIKSTGTGTATGTFVGAAGTYWLDVTWFNENDGAAQFTVLVNGVEVKSWTGTGGTSSGEATIERIGVNLDYGDEITLRGVKNLGEPARIDFFTISATSGNTDPNADDDDFTTGVGTPLTVAAPGILDNDSDLDGDTLNVSQIVTDVANGTLAWNADGSFTYTPNGGFSGEDSFTYEVSDGNGGTAEATVTITVEDPGAIDGALIDVGVTEAESLDLGGAYAVETSTKPEISGGAMIKSTGTGTATGTFVGAAGTYWLDVTWFNENDGAAQFTVLVNGVEVQSWTGTGGTSSGEATIERIGVNLDYGDEITLRGVKNLGEPARIDFFTISATSGNTDPNADDDDYVTDMGTPLTITAPGILDNDSDLDGDTLNVSQIVTDVANGTLAWNADGSFTYTPNGGFTGDDSFTYEVSDGNGGTAEATVTITVEDPYAVDGALIDFGATEAESLDLGGAYAVETSSDPDVSGGAMIKSTGTGTATGTFVGAAGSYSLNVTWFNENDGEAQFSVLINGTQVAFWTGAGGETSGEAVVQRIPVTLAYGDTITLQGVRDGGEPARIDLITITEPNVAPVAEDGSSSGAEDTVINGTVTASDSDGDPLTFAKATDPSNGSVVVNSDGSYSYTPDVDFSGSDSFTYEVSDGRGGTDTGTVSITVDPTAFGEISLGLTEAEDLLLSGGYGYEAITHRDVPSGAGIRAIGTGEAEGVFVSASGTYWLDVAWLNEHDGASTFTVLINDVEISSWTGTGGDPSVDREVQRIAVTLGTNDVITLRGVQGNGENARIDSILITDQSQNTAPIARADSYTAYENTTLNLTVPTLLANDEDLDGDSISVSQVVTDVSNGTLSVNPDGTFTYTPDAEFLGEDSFTYEVSDGNGGTAQAVATITVQEQTPPDGALIDVGVTEAETLDLSGGYAVETLTHADVPSGQGIMAVGSGSATGSFVGASGAYWLDVAWMNEHDGASTFTVLVNGVQQATWTGTGGAPSVDREIQRIPVTLNYGDVITIQGVQQNGENARVDLITLTSQSENTAPVARADSYSMVENTVLSITLPGVLANDEDLDGDGITVSQVITDVAHGTLTLNADGSFSYTPDADYVGDDSFTYEISDGNGGTTEAVVTLAVQEQTLPEGALIDVGVTEAETLDLSGGYATEVIAHADVPSNAAIKSVGTGQATGSFIGSAGSYWIDVAWLNESDGASQYTLFVDGVEQSSWTGTGGAPSVDREIQRVGVDLSYGDVITIRGVQESGENARVDTIVVTGQADNSNPYARADFYTATQGIPKNVAADGVLENDEDLDGDTITVSQVLTDVQHGTLTLNADGSFTYTADSEFLGDDTFTYEVVDGNGGTATATATITVGELNAPIGLGETEAEALELSGGYIVESTPHADVPSGFVIGTTTSGNATGTFTGPSGLYWLDATWMNEHDGAASFSVLINGESVASWTGTGGEAAITMETHRIGVELQTGDSIVLNGIRSTGENARFDKIAIAERTPVYSGLDAADFDNFAFAGQSNAERHFLRDGGDFSEGPMGFVAFEAEVEGLTGGMTTAINVAVGGSGSNEVARDDLFWWDLGNNQPGQVLLDAVADIQAAMETGEDLDGIIWSQGETDAFAIDVGGADETATIDRLVTATTAVFNHFWSVFGADVPIFIQELGDITIYDSMPGLRDAQAQLATDLDNVYIGALTTTYALYDDLHFSVDGYNDIAVDLATTAVDTIMSDTLFT
ncbi:cadherin-like domain-containing protein [Pseudooceanicola sp.]|uniref:cadherin-like domain-containing protein n=1 Tax=Pseudooceanicola sp. TaxID=1914328 RepID=UPI003516D639